MPEDVPTGEVPRHVQVVVEQSLVGRAAPGTRVVICGIMSIVGGSKRVAGGAPAIRMPYIRAVGLRVVERGAGRSAHVFTPAEVAVCTHRLCNVRMYVLVSSCKLISHILFLSCACVRHAIGHASYR